MQFDLSDEVKAALRQIVDIAQNACSAAAWTALECRPDLLDRVNSVSRQLMQRVATDDLFDVANALNDAARSLNAIDNALFCTSAADLAIRAIGVTQILVDALEFDKEGADLLHATSREFALAMCAHEERTRDPRLNKHIDPSRPKWAADSCGYTGTTLKQRMQRAKRLRFAAGA